MKKTEIKIAQKDFPERLHPFLSGKVYDSSSSPQAKVFYLSSCSAYLKRAAKGTLMREAIMNDYFHSKGLCRPVISYFTEGEFDWLLTERVDGEDATHDLYLSKPKRLAEQLGVLLRQLHELDFSDCPVQNRQAEYFAAVCDGYRRKNFDGSFLPQASGIDEAWNVFSRGKDALNERVLLHGDFCLPNIILDGFKLSGYIDLGGAGVGDRHVDLFWGAWTLCFNLKTDKYRDTFFDAYGRSLINLDAIRTVAAAECFG